jgi:plastocyanin
MIHRNPWRVAIFAAGSMAAANVVANAQQVAATAPDEIVIENFQFLPATLTVAPGTAVTWISHDEEPHNILSIGAPGQPRLFRSQAMTEGEKYTFVFDKPGTYNYICSVHPHMQGTIVAK